MMITARRASRSVTMRIRRRARRWWTRWRRTPGRCSSRSTAASLRRGRPSSRVVGVGHRPGSGSGLSTACFGLPGGLPRTGSSRPLTPTPVTGIRPPRAVLTATRVMSSIDPDSELIIATTVTAGNGGDAAAAGELLADELPTTDRAAEHRAGRDRARRCTSSPSLSTVTRPTAQASSSTRSSKPAAEVNRKAQPPVAPGGRFSKDAFTIDLEGDTVTCPAGTHPVVAAVRRRAYREVRHCMCGHVRWPSGARPPKTVARSTSASTSSSSRAPARASQTLPGRPTTRPPARRSSARSRTSCAAATAAAARACAASRRPQPTSPCSPPP